MSAPPSTLASLKTSLFGKRKEEEASKPAAAPRHKDKPSDAELWAEFNTASSKLSSTVADEVPLIPVPARVLEAQRSDPDKWTVSWDPDGDPAHISCWTAASIAQNCITPLNRFRHLYRDGKMPECMAKVDDVMLCLRIRAMASSDPEKAKRVLAEKHPRVPSSLPTEHVWRFRDKPPANFCAIPITTPAASTPQTPQPPQPQSQST